MRRLADQLLLGREIEHTPRLTDACYRNGGFGAEYGTYRLRCECGAADCTEEVELPAGLYDELRADHARHLVAPGHELDAQVIASGRGYKIIAVAGGGLAPARRPSAA